MATNKLRIKYHVWKNNPILEICTWKNVKHHVFFFTIFWTAFFSIFYFRLIKIILRNMIHIIQIGFFVKTSKIQHSLVIKSQPNEYSVICLFQNCQGISVSIGINAKCRYCAVMRMTADALVFETDFFFHFALCCLPKLLSVMCRIPRANLHWRNWKYEAVAFCILRSWQTKSFSCI